MHLCILEITDACVVTASIYTVYILMLGKYRPAFNTEIYIPALWTFLPGDVCYIPKFYAYYIL